MTIKTLLLGTAAAVAVVGGAQAADLSVAEPVEYVKVCDYFGTGYWYIPGTDNCIKIGGHVTLLSNFEKDSYIYGSHSSSWAFQAEQEVTFDVKSETEYGVLEGFAELEADVGYGEGPGVIGSSAGPGGDQGAVYSDAFYLALGGFKAGYFSPAAEQGSTYMDTFGIAGNAFRPINGATKLDTAELAWATGGMGVTVSVSDPSPILTGSLGYNASDSTPILSGLLSFTSKKFSAGLSGFYMDTTDGADYGITGTATIALTSMDNLWLEGNYGNNLFTGTDGAFGAYGNGHNDGYSLTASWQHVLSKTLNFDVDAEYAKGDTGHFSDGQSAWDVGADLVWAPVAGFRAKAAVLYTSNTYSDGSTTNSWVAELGVRRDW